VGAALSFLVGTSGVLALKPELLSGVLTVFGQRQNPQQKVVKILVVDFDGPDPQKYRVTENILNEIRSKTNIYKDVEIISLGRVLTERDGKVTARKIGQEQQVDIVIWGWYAAAKQNAQVSVNFELLNQPNLLPEMGKEMQGQVRTTTISQIESFTLQVNLAKEMTYLSLVTLGMSRYSSNDWDGTMGASQLCDE
jgi:hypothetical protein